MKELQSGYLSRYLRIFRSAPIAHSLIFLGGRLNILAMMLKVQLDIIKIQTGFDAAFPAHVYRFRLFLGTIF